MPLQCGREQAGLSQGRLIAGDLMDRVSWCHVEVRRNLTELGIEIEDHGRAGHLRGQPRRQVHGYRGGTRPALRRENGDHSPLAPIPNRGFLVVCWVQVARSAQSDGKGLDPRVELSRVEGTAHHVVRTRLEQLDPVLDVLRIGDRQDRETIELGSAAHELTGGDRIGDRPDEVEDDDLGGGRGRARRQGLRRTGGDHDLMAGCAKGLGNHGVGRPGNQQDSAGGQG